MTIRILSSPHPGDLADLNNGIAQVIWNLASRITEHGFTYVHEPENADLIVRHAGAQGGPRVDVTHCHGLLPTGMRTLENWAWEVNSHVIDNLLRARAITVPSQWVGDLIRRDMRTEPDVVGWGINPEEWQPGKNEGYVLWAKGRPGDVCSPEPLNRLAASAPAVPFATTFGESAGNVRVIGLQDYAQMKRWLQGAGVYLATTRETFGIQTLEAMACGVPILGFRQAATPDLVTHLESGYLAEPGNYDDLLAGLHYCIQHRKRMSAAAREAALGYTWERAAGQMAAIYRRVLEPHSGPTASIIIPCWNYAQWVGGAIESALAQQGADFEVIVVDDGSTDGSAQVVERYRDRARIVHKENGGVASARNAGAALAKGKYLAFLDADDLMEPGWLRATAAALEGNDRAGIAYSRLQILATDGQILQTDWPPQEPDLQRLMHGQNQVPTCCLIRREAFERAGGYRRRFEPAEDGELWLKIVECGWDVVCASPKPLFTYRMGHASLSRGVRLPNVMSWHQPTRTGSPPFPALGSPARKSWPVRDYDRPVISVIIRHQGDEGALVDTLDSLLGQTYAFWEALIDGPELRAAGYPFVKSGGTEKASAPMMTVFDAGETLDPLFLERALVAWQTRGAVEGILPRVWYEQVGGLARGETVIDLKRKLAQTGLIPGGIPDVLAGRKEQRRWHAEIAQETQATGRRSRRAQATALESA